MQEMIALYRLCQKLRGIPEVPPQRITDLATMQRDNCINSVAFWISASCEVSQAQKLCCYRPVPKKDLALLRKSTTPTYRTPLARMSFKRSTGHSAIHSLVTRSGGSITSSWGLECGGVAPLDGQASWVNP